MRLTSPPHTLIGFSELGRGGEGAGNSTTALLQPSTRSFIVAIDQRSDREMGTFMVCYNIPSIAINIFEPEIKTFNIYRLLISFFNFL